MADIHSKSIVKLSRMYSYDLEKDRLLFDNVEQELKPKHQQIIRLLASNVERVVDFDMLRHYVWDDIHVDAATIRAEMHRVRQALKEDLIVSIKGIGYKLAKH